MNDHTPRVEVRNLNYLEEASEETHCFSATVYVDGKPMCKARNRGHGGADEYWPLEAHAKKKGSGEAMREIREGIEAVGAAMADSEINGKPANFDARTRFEIAVGDAVNRALLQREVRRLCKSRAVFIIGGALYEMKPRKGVPVEQVVERARQKYPQAVIVNDLSIDEAVRQMRAAH